MKLFIGVAAVLSVSSMVAAETHTIRFDNKYVLWFRSVRTSAEYPILGAVVEP